jgi:hypothetical protein
MRARFCNPTWKEIISIGGLILKVLVELSCFAIWNYGFESLQRVPGFSQEAGQQRSIALRKPLEGSSDKGEEETSYKNTLEAAQENEEGESRKLQI